jgi:hypothetical protein
MNNYCKVLTNLCHADITATTPASIRINSSVTIIHYWTIQGVTGIMWAQDHRLAAGNKRQNRHKL